MIHARVFRVQYGMKDLIRTRGAYEQLFLVACQIHTHKAHRGDIYEDRV